MTKALTLLTTFDEVERPLARAATEQLTAAIGAVAGTALPIELVLTHPDDVASVAPVRIVSMSGDVLRDERIGATYDRWLERVNRWRGQGAGSILLSTLFRKVPAGIGHPRIERLRALNMMAVRLSRATGVVVVDLDRLFALFGARTLQTDYRCHGQHAARLGGNAIAAAIVNGDLDDFLPPHVQGRAARRLGEMEAWPTS